MRSIQDKFLEFSLSINSETDSMKSTTYHAHVQGPRQSESNTSFSNNVWKVDGRLDMHHVKDATVN